ncbi:MAG: outer membrane beta-barrel protein [Candidatus Thiodiazotropha sp.]
MHRVYFLTVWLFLTACSSSLLAGNDLEFAPFAGQRFGGSFELDSDYSRMDVDNSNDWGFTISQAASDTTRYEFLYSHQDSSLADTTDPDNAFDLDIHYVHLGGTVDVHTLNYRKEKITPYITGGLGMTIMNPSHRGYEDETRFSLSVGGGLKWYPTERLGIRFEMRGYSTLIDSNETLFCDAGCSLQIEGDAFPQFETNLGLIFSF